MNKGIHCPACGTALELDDILGGLCPVCSCLIDEATLRDTEDGREEWGEPK
jgi:predicted nucleic acid-binding Zn ribbon protein